MSYHLELKNVTKDFGSTSIIRGANLVLKKEKYTLLLALMVQENLHFII